MKLHELRLFARNEGGSGISPAAARALNLPMPEDVLEQFILDHGLNHDFQERYGDLNLYALAWSRELLETGQIIGCTSKFDRYVQEIAERHMTAITLEQAVFHVDARSFWAERGTWLRAPLFFWEVFPPPDEHHLVEGHTRLGALIGFHRNPKPPVRLSATHVCWIGRPVAEPAVFDWRAVRRLYPLSFKQWIYDAIGDQGTKALIADALLETEHRNRYTMSIGDDLPDLIGLIRRVPIAGLSVSTLEELHSQWMLDLAR
jgi:hypothetical protein